MLTDQTTPEQRVLYEGVVRVYLVGEGAAGPR